VFNLAQMTDFISLRFSAYYERRLLDYAHLRQIRPPRNKYLPYADQQINFVSDDIYEIESSEKNGTTYIVNMAVCMCTCSVGATGKFCEHIYYVHTQTNCGDVSDRLLDQRELMYYLAWDKLPGEGWMDTQHDQDETSSSSVHLPSDVAMETSDQDVDLQTELQRVHTMFTDTLKKVILERAGSDSPRDIIAGYKAAITMLNKITTTSAASSFLHTLGHCPEASVSLTKFDRLGNIPVQPTAIVRKRKCLRRGIPIPIK